MENVWIIGSGQMSIEYAKILTSLQINFKVIGRGIESANRFKKEIKQEVVTGGLENFLKTKPKLPQKVICAVRITQLFKTCTLLLNYGVKSILLEKPGATHPQEITLLSKLATKMNAQVLLAYNRRFYASVLKVKELIKEDGGLTSFHFEFTEWSHRIKVMDKDKEELNNWFLANSTHIIDTAFFIGGLPKKMCSFHKGGEAWHPSATLFSGAGESSSGALFSYSANWEAPGRWSMEFMTKKRRFVFKPIEELKCIDLGSIKVYDIDLDDTNEQHFKPGLYLQTKSFVENELTHFIDINGQREMLENHYLTMCPLAKK